jgi:hypothetical protein
MSSPEEEQPRRPRPPYAPEEWIPTPPSDVAEWGRRGGASYHRLEGRQDEGVGGDDLAGGDALRADIEGS